jgi:hypothetical protein
VCTTRPRLGVAIILIGALLALAVATTPTAPRAGHASPAPSAEAPAASTR